jgi:hypothetical protein
LLASRRGGNRWARTKVDLSLTLKSRRVGSFGTSPLGRLLEWLTLIWWRFTCALIAVPIAIGLSTSLPADQKLGLVIASPLLALTYWYLLLLTLLVCRALGRPGRILAHLVVVYFFLFSRFVVQGPPAILLHLT